MINLSRKICLIALLIIGSLLSFYAFNLLFIAICNHRGVSRVTLAGFPIYMVIMTIVCLILYNYRLLTHQENTFVLSKHYGLTIMITSLIGIAFSILAGAWVYKSFTKEWIFTCYPLVMILVHTLIFLASGYLFLISKKQLKINPEEKKRKINAYYVFYNIGFVSLLLYALNRAGAFLLLPVFWSIENSFMMIPFYLQLLLPLLILIIHCLYKHFLKEEKKRLLVYISCGIIVGYSVFSMIYTGIITYYNYPNAINVLSPLLQLERLVTFPIDYIAIYSVCICLPLSSLICFGIKEMINYFKKQSVNKEEIDVTL